MRIATWNVNSIKQRQDALLAWLKRSGVDLVCLQELKCQDEGFPRAMFEDAGYNVVTHGQKAFNGVALLSKQPLEDVMRGLPGDDSDEQSRYIEAVVSTPKGIVRVGGLYLPNGNPVDSPKYPYKISWMDRLIAHARARLALEEPFILAGDYNVIPHARDVHNPAAWAEDALFRYPSRAKFYELLNLGFTDSVRACSDAEKLYTFWDYQAGAWQKNNGIRIDHLLLSPQAADRLVSAEIIKDLRGEEKPSDHVPVVAELALH